MIQVSLRSRQIETLLLSARCCFRFWRACLSSASKLTLRKGFLENQEIVLVAAFNFRPKINVRNQTILPCNCSSAFVPTCVWARSSSMLCKSSAVLSGVCPNCTVLVSASSVSITRPSVLNLLENGGAFEPSDAKFMPNNLNRASA